MTAFVKIQAAKAAEVIQGLDFSEDDAPSKFSPEDHPVEAVNKLFASNYHVDALRVLAHSLPKREAVWWACLAVRHTLEGEQSGDGQALVAAEAWARQPTEPNRQLCKQLAEKLEYKTAAAWAATAATWCTGSIADDDQPEVAPPEKLYAHAVSGAVSLAAVTGDPAQAELHYQRFLDQGLNLASGGNGQI